MTPGAEVASLVSMALIRAWANGLRTMARCSMPGQLDVVGPAGASGDQPLVLLALARLADLGGGPVVDGGHQATLPAVTADSSAALPDSAIVLAHADTALTMLW